MDLRALWKFVQPNVLIYISIRGHCISCVTQNKEEEKNEIRGAFYKEYEVIPI